MQQGLLVSLLLSSTLMMGSVSATELQPKRVSALLQDEQLNQRVEDLYQSAITNDVDALNFSLNRLSLPQQEAARFLVIQHLEDNNVALTPVLAKWLQQQLDRRPTYQVSEQGDGYVITKVAFNYPAVVQRLLHRWEKDQQVLDFILSSERQELQLSDWLSGSAHELKVKQEILLNELDSLSPEALQALVEQVTQHVVSAWLPSTEVMVELAKVSQDPQVYKVLWQMRADQYSLSELQRLANLAPDLFATEQVIAATQNPSLKVRALGYLAQLHPLPNNVREFLLVKLNHVDDGSIVATQLARSGHASWLQQLLGERDTVRQNNVKAGLSHISQ